VSWYDVVKWCNAKSEKEGKTAVYLVNGAVVYRSGKIREVSQIAGANGYRLPSEAEWEWAATGGIKTHGYAYSGSDDPNTVSWTKKNFSNTTKAVGTKAGNELGIYDMSGNVCEWCWDGDGSYYRRIRGGSWNGIADDATVSYRDINGMDDPGYESGFRVASSSGN